MKVEINYGDGTSRSKKLHAFDGTGGLEGLLYVEEEFRKAANNFFHFNGYDWFTYFPEVLKDAASDKWNNVLNQLPEDNATMDSEEDFNVAMQLLYVKYSDKKS